MAYEIWHISQPYRRLLYLHGPDQFQSDDRALVQSHFFAFGQKDSGGHACAHPRQTSDGRPPGKAAPVGTRQPPQQRDRHACLTNGGCLEDVINNIAAARALLQRSFSVGLHFFVASEIGGRFQDRRDLLLRPFQSDAVESDVELASFERPPSRLSQRDPPDHFRAFSQQPAAVNEHVTAHDRSDFVAGFAQFRANRIEQCELNLGTFGNDRLAVLLLRETGRADREADHGKQKNRQAIPLQHLVTSFEKRREPRGRRYVTLY